GKVGPERRVGAEMAERFGLERTHLANRAGLFGATAFFGDEPRERVADVAGRVRVVLQRAQRVLQKLGQRGLAVRAGDRDDAAAPAERREVEFAETFCAGGARALEPRVLRRKTRREDDERMGARRDGRELRAL